MPGESDVINVGLRRIGADPIVNRTDGSVSANAVDDIYDQLRDSLLRKHPWNFATKREKLNQSTTVPVFEFDHAYPLPAAWLRTISVHNNDAGHGTFLYRMELINGQRAIVTSSDDVWLRYIAVITDPNLWAADFTDAFEFALARDLAVPLASSNTMRDEMNKEFKLAIAAARSTDAMGSFPERRPRGSWANSRGGGRNDYILHG